MHESAKRIVAKCLVMSRIQNQLMPQIIRDLRGHSDELATAFKVSQKKLAQCASRQLAILDREFRTVGLEFFEYPRRKHVSANVVRPRRLPPARPDDQQGDAQEQRDDEEGGHKDKVLQSAKWKARRAIPP